MSNIIIKQAQENDISVIENLLLDTVNWLNEIKQPLWSANEIKWDILCKNYRIEDFYIAYTDGVPSGCMALIDYDPFFWPEIKKGESLFIHKLSVTKSARKTGVADTMMDFFKMQGAERRVKSIRLDTDALRPKTRAFYERHGFTFIEAKIMGTFHVAFYIYMMKKPFVLSISGTSGSGKTTIVSALKERLANSALLYFDDYGDDVHISQDINDWSSDGGDCNEFNTEPIAADIERLIEESYDFIILDYPFGKLNDCVGKYIDLTVFVDTPLDVALARRIIRDYTSRSKESDFGLADVEAISLKAIDKDLRLYLSCSRPTYERMSDTHKLVSDCVVDGTKSPENIANEIVKHISIK